MDKILFIKAGIQDGWYIEAHIEYIIRYLGHKFFIEQADLPYPPYENFLDRFPETSPLMRNPNDYDLLIPELGTHWHLGKGEERFKYAHKLGCLSWEGAEGYHEELAAVGALNPFSEKGYKEANIPYHSLRIGIDTNLFQPYPLARTDNLLHVGMVGSYLNPRRRVKEIIKTLKDLKSIRLMIFPQNWVNKGGDIKQVGGMEFVKRVVDGGKKWTGLPNCYNQMDVLIRIDQDDNYGFPVIEAAACGVPVIATPRGNCPSILDNGGGITINPDDSQQLKAMRQAVLWMKNHPVERKAMGKMARAEVEKNWTWDKHIGNWEKFFEEGIKNAKKN